MFTANLEPEAEQSVVRLLLGGIVMLYLLFFTRLQPWMIPSFIGYFFIALALAYSIYLTPGHYPWRILFGQVIDIGALSIDLYLCGAAAVPLVGVYLWIIIGNGGRFGILYMLSATVLVNACFVYIVLHEPFWRDHWNFALGIGLMQLVVPVYSSVLLGRLAATRKKLELLSYSDGLTGLLNRRSFDKQLQAETLRLQRFPAPVTIALIDIDHFKNINDTYGHLVGDLVLKNVAEVLKETCREIDTVARFGGEEFALILPGLQQFEKQALGDRVRRAVARASVLLNDGDAVMVTVSIGMAGWDRRFSDKQDWLLAADTALYQAKNQGRDLVVVSELVLTELNALS